MTCDEIMKGNVQTVREDQTIQEAAEIMAREKIGFLPVCDGSGSVIGTVTDRDLAVRAVARNKSPASCRIAEVMTREVVSCRPTDDLSTAEQSMIQHHKARIVVTNAAGDLCGVISLSDLAEREPGKRAALVLRGVSSREARHS